ncbi:MAG: pyocin knob domain-containing protein, partial [Clostridiales bacterium]|nr:pyocin knob domain-containing protein [Clostridiales bacterium]
MSSLIMNRPDNDNRYYTQSNVDRYLNKKMNAPKKLAQYTTTKRILQEGIYYGDNCHGLPNEYAGSFGLEVIKLGDDGLIQIFYSKDTEDIYIRSYTFTDVESGAGTWSDWTLITYSLGTTTKEGLTKLYTTKGSAADGTLTQKAIDDNYLSKSGGPMNGNIIFAPIGDVATSYGMVWSGSSDGAGIYYQTNGADMGNLVLNVKDDNTCSIVFANNGVYKSWVDANGSYNTAGGAIFPSDGNVYVNSPQNNCVGYLSNLLAG